MEIRIRSTGQVMYESEFRDLYKHNPVPLQITAEWLDTFEGGCDVVLEGPQATGGTVYQYSMRQGVEQIDGQWFTKYVLGPIFVDNEQGTAAEQEAAYKAMKDAEQAKSVRADRNRRLADCDWTQLADSPVDKAVWAAYRQALRDVPTQSGFPWNVTWPEVPNV